MKPPNGRPQRPGSKSERTAMRPAAIADRLRELRRRLTLETVNIRQDAKLVVFDRIEETQREILVLVLREEDTIVGALQAADCVWDLPDDGER